MNSVNWPSPIVWVFIAQLVEHCSANEEATGSNRVEAPKNYYTDCDGHISISFVFPQFIIHFIVPVSFFSRVDEEHCSANAEATGSNPAEAPTVTPSFHLSVPQFTIYFVD